MPLLHQGRDNLASAGLGRARLNGQVYTPMRLAERIMRGRAWAGLLLDPACGDGVFLEAAVREAVRVGEPARVARIEGWDLDPEAVQAARERLQPVCAELGVPGPGEAGGPSIVLADALEREPTGPVSQVVGNPPYLESKRMPDALKARVREVCPHAGRGGFDLYAAFVERAAGWLDAGAELSFVVPNRILVTRATAALRRWLLERGEVGVEDLSKADVFGAAAAVYPVVFSFRPGSKPGYVVGVEDQAVRFPVALVRDRLDGLLPLPPGDQRLRQLLVRVLDDPELPPLSSRLKVRWTVSFHRGGLRDQYVFDDRPDSPHAARFLGGGRYAGNRELAPFQITWGGSWIDYDEARARADRNGLPPRALFAAPKVVFAQNARRCRAALDEDGLIVKDTFPVVTSTPTAHADDLPWLTVVLNSELFHVLYEALYGGTRKGGKYLHFLGGYLHPFPLPSPPAGVRALHAALQAHPDDPELRVRAEALVRQAYGVDADEAAALDQVAVPEP